MEKSGVGYTAGGRNGVLFKKKFGKVPLEESNWGVGEPVDKGGEKSSKWIVTAENERK